MGKPHPIELRERAVGLVEQGSTHTEAARRLCVSIKFVNDMVRLKRETGSLAPKPQGNPGRGKLTGVKGWVPKFDSKGLDFACRGYAAHVFSMG